MTCVCVTYVKPFRVYIVQQNRILMTTHKEWQNDHVCFCLFSIAPYLKIAGRESIIGCLLCANPYNPYISYAICHLPCVMSNYKFQALIIDLPLLMDEWDCNVWRYLESLTFVTSLFAVKGEPSSRSLNCDRICWYLREITDSRDEHIDWLRSRLYCFVANIDSFCLKLNTIKFFISSQ